MHSIFWKDLADDRHTSSVHSVVLLAAIGKMRECSTPLPTQPFWLAHSYMITGAEHAEHPSHSKKPHLSDHGMPLAAHQLVQRGAGAEPSAGGEGTGAGAGTATPGDDSHFPPLLYTCDFLVAPRRHNVHIPTVLYSKYRHSGWVLHSAAHVAKPTLPPSAAICFSALPAHL